MLSVPAGKRLKIKGTVGVNSNDLSYDQRYPLTQK